MDPVEVMLWALAVVAVAAAVFMLVGLGAAIWRTVRDMREDTR